MELVFILSVVLLQTLLFVNLLQIVEIVRAVRIYTFMEDEVFPFLLSHKRIAAVRAAKGKLLGETVFSGREVSTTDLAAKLPCFARCCGRDKVWEHRRKGNSSHRGCHRVCA